MYKLILDSDCEHYLFSPLFDRTVSLKQTKIIFGSNRNKPKQDLFRVCFGLFRETKTKKFRFVSVFRTYIETTKTNWTVSTNRNNPKFSEKYPNVFSFKLIIIIIISIIYSWKTSSTILTWYIISDIHFIFLSNIIRQYTRLHISRRLSTLLTHWVRQHTDRFKKPYEDVFDHRASFFTDTSFSSIRHYNSSLYRQ